MTHSLASHMAALFEGEGALTAAILFNSIILFGFLRRFYRRNIAPIRSQSKTALFWKNAWNFISVGVLFLMLSSLFDLLKFADVGLFYGASIAKSLFDIGFLVCLTAGIHMLRQRFAQ